MLPRSSYILKYENGNYFKILYMAFKTSKTQLIGDILLFIANSKEFANSNNCEDLIQQLNDPDVSFTQFKKIIYDYIVSNR